MSAAEFVHNILLEVLEKSKIGDDYSNLFEQGLDSFKAIQLIVILEEKLGIAFDDEDLLLDNFETIEKIVKTIEKNKAS